MLAHTVPANSDEFKGYPLARRQTASGHIHKEKNDLTHPEPFNCQTQLGVETLGNPNPTSAGIGC